MGRGYNKKVDDIRVVVSDQKQAQRLARRERFEAFGSSWEGRMDVLARLERAGRVAKKKAEKMNAGLRESKRSLAEEKRAFDAKALKALEDERATEYKVGRREHAAAAKEVANERKDQELKKRERRLKKRETFFDEEDVLIKEKWREVKAAESRLKEWRSEMEKHQRR